MERPPFSTRARRRIWRDTLAFFRGRVIPLGIGVVGVIVAFLFNYFYIHTKTAKEILELGIISIVSSYGIFFLGSLIVNTARVPWLLDADSGKQINTFETRVLTAEAQLDEREATRKEHRRLHDLFGSRMQQGVNLSDSLTICRTRADFNAWDESFDSWLDLVRTLISQDLGLYTASVEFIRAGEDAEPVKGVMDLRNEKEQRGRVLAQHQKKLEEIVHRRLP